MKQYNIWLKSGACVTGEVQDCVASGLIEEYKKHGSRTLQFDDTEGNVIVEEESIAAIAINDITEQCRKVGF